MKKYKIGIQVNNKINNYSSSYKYHYDNHDIIIKANQESFIISFEITKGFKSYKTFQNYIVDIYKKISLIYLIKYEKTLLIKTVIFSLSDKELIKFEYDKNDKVMFELVDKLKDRISNRIKNDKVIYYLLGYTKSKYDYKIAALFAYLCAKSKVYENDRLQYYWMAFNGFYNRYRKPDEKSIQECELIRRLLVGFGYGSQNITKNDREKNVLPIISLLVRIGLDKFKTNSKVLKSDIENSNDIFKNKFDEINFQYDLTPYGYILTQVAYYYRCNIFHANKPVDLFLTKYENNIFAMKVVNDLLEEFLDEHLFSLFY